MVLYDQDSWKKKIDPAFDKPVKIYLKCLNIVERLPNEGQVTFNDESIELVRKKHNLKADYGTESGTEMIQFVENVGLFSEQELKGYLNAIDALDKYRKHSKWINNAGIITRFLKKLFFRYTMRDDIASQMDSLIPLIEILPEEESRQYYANKVNVFVNDICTRHSSPSQDEMELIQHCILIRIVLAKIDEVSEEKATKEEIKHVRESTIVISKTLGFINSIMSQLSHQKDMRALLDNMEKGDDDSLLKAITIDKSLLSSEPVAKRVSQALAAGDDRFQRKLLNRHKKRPLKRVGQHGQMHAVLDFFWNIELYKLNDEELYYFLEYCGLIPPSLPYAFPKCMGRYRKK